MSISNFSSRVKEGEIISKDVIKNIMVIKLRDEKKHLRELMVKKQRLRAEFKTIKKNSK